MHQNQIRAPQPNRCIQRTLKHCCPPHSPRPLLRICSSALGYSLCFCPLWEQLRYRLFFVNMGHKKKCLILEGVVPTSWKRARVSSRPMKAYFLHLIKALHRMLKDKHLFTDFNFRIIQDNLHLLFPKFKLFYAHTVPLYSITGQISFPVTSFVFSGGPWDDISFFQLLRAIVTQFFCVQLHFHFRSFRCSSAGFYLALKPAEEFIQFSLPSCSRLIFSHWINHRFYYASLCILNNFGVLGLLLLLSSWKARWRWTSLPFIKANWDEEWHLRFVSNKLFAPTIPDYFATLNFELVR